MRHHRPLTTIAAVAALAASLSACGSQPEAPAASQAADAAASGFNAVVPAIERALSGLQVLGGTTRISSPAEGEVLVETGGPALAEPLAARVAQVVHDEAGRLEHGIQRVEVRAADGSATVLDCRDGCRVVR